MKKHQVKAVADLLLMIITRRPNCPKRIRKFSLPAGRIASIVDISKPPEDIANSDLKADGANFHFKLADSCRLIFTPLQAEAAKRVGQSTLDGAVSIPIVKLAEIEVGKVEQEGFVSFFTNDVVRPSTELRFKQKP
ncbi:MAG: hypothetical protein P8N76_28335 [Pirellulaceae bacterium]|nr:hypothetical protein [Pirellulaceae bacterium]